MDSFSDFLFHWKEDQIMVPVFIWIISLIQIQVLKINSPTTERILSL